MKDTKTTERETDELPTADTVDTAAGQSGETELPVARIPTVADAESEAGENHEPGIPTPETPPVDVDLLVAEAERRGYMRGRNEALSERMEAPGLWELATVADDFAATAGEEVTILNGIRPGVWDCF